MTLSAISVEGGGIVGLFVDVDDEALRPNALNPPIPENPFSGFNELPKFRIDSIGELVAAGSSARCCCCVLVLVLRLLWLDAALLLPGPTLAAKATRLLPLPEDCALSALRSRGSLRPAMRPKRFSSDLEVGGGLVLVSKGPSS